MFIQSVLAPYNAVDGHMYAPLLDQSHGGGLSQAESE
jgi:hypothetical protein